MPLPHGDIELDNHYETLGVEPQASQDEIRSRYKHLSLTCHPDKLPRPAPTHTPQSARRATGQFAQAQDRWRKIEHAHDVLSDPLTRAIYDLSAGFVSDTPAEHARVARLKRKDALRAVATMEETVAAIRAEEAAKGGLLIVHARYGDLSQSDVSASQAITAPFIDVTVPLQCLVQESSLILPAGRSRVWLEGFYDPTMGENPAANRLYVKYKFLGHMHEAEFDDEEEAAMPLEEHYIGEQQEETLTDEDVFVPGTRSSKGLSESALSRSTLLARQKARRRLMLYSTLALTGLGVYFFRKYNYSLAAIKADAQVWGEWIKQIFANKGAKTQKMLLPATNTQGQAQTSASTLATTAPKA